MGVIRTQGANTFPDGHAVEKAAVRALFGLIEDQLAAGSLGLVGFKTWTELAESEGAADNALALVAKSDGGTHVDPVTEESVANAGYYRWNAAAPGWERLDLATLGGSLVFLEPTEASTDSLIEYAIAPGSEQPNDSGNHTLFIGAMPFDKPAETGIRLRIQGYGEEALQLRTLAGAQIPDGAYVEGDWVLFIRPADGPWAALTFFSGDLGGSGGGGSASPFVRLQAVETEGDAPDRHLVFEPAPGSSVSGGGENLVFLAPMAFDRPLEGGVLVKVLGVNSDEEFQLRTLGDDQMPAKAYAAGDYGLFIRPEGTHYKALQFFNPDLGVVAPDPTVAIALAAATDNAARAATRARRIAKALAALVLALGFAGGAVAKVPFAGGELRESNGGLAYGSTLIEGRPAAYAGDDLTLDFANGYYQVGAQRTRALRALAGFVMTRAGARGERIPNTRTQFVPADVPAILPGIGLWSRQSNTNLLLNSATLSTQAVTLSAVPYTLSFIGSGSVTLSGAATGTLTGTGPTDRVSQTFTPTAGAVTFTVSGSVKLATLFTGSLTGPIIVTAGATATAAGDALSLAYSLDDEPWFVMVKVDLRVAGTTARILCLNDSNSSNTLLLARTSGNAFDVRVTVAGALQSVGLPTNPTTETTGPCILGLRRDAAGKYSAAWKRTDGVIGVGAPGAAAPMPPGLCRIDPGNFFGSDQPQSPISLVRVIRADLTDAEITAILGAA